MLMADRWRVPEVPGPRSLAGKAAFGRHSAGKACEPAWSGKPLLGRFVGRLAGKAVPGSSERLDRLGSVSAAPGREGRFLARKAACGPSCPCHREGRLWAVLAGKAAPRANITNISSEY
jgi:hypothetical protein